MDTCTGGATATYYIQYIGSHTAVMKVYTLIRCCVLLPYVYRYKLTEVHVVCTSCISSLLGLCRAVYVYIVCSAFCAVMSLCQEYHYCARRYHAPGIASIMQPFGCCVGRKADVSKVHPTSVGRSGEYTL